MFYLCETSDFFPNVNDKSYPRSLKQIFPECVNRGKLSTSQLNFNGKQDLICSDTYSFVSPNLPITRENFYFRYNRVKFVAILLAESRALCMYKTLNMSTNLRSASRTPFVAQFKQLTVLLVLSWRSKFNALRLQAIKTYTVAEKL